MFNFCFAPTLRELKIFNFFALCGNSPTFGMTKRYGLLKISKTDIIKKRDSEKIKYVRICKIRECNKNLQKKFY